MNKLILIALIFMAFSCKNDDKNATSKDGKTGQNTETNTENTKQVEATSIYEKEDGKYYFQYNLEKGKSYPYYIKEIQNMTQSIDSKSAKNTVENIDKLLFTVTDIKNGIYYITVKLEQKKSTATIYGQTVTMDSNGAEPKGPEKIMWKVNKALVSSSFTMQMDKEGNISNVQGMEAMINKAKQAVSGDLPADQLNALGEQLSQTQNPEAFKENFKHSQITLPKTGIKIGESWSDKTGDNLTTVYTLKSISNGIAQVAIAGNITPVQKSKTEQGINLSLKITGNQKGTAYINTQSGWMDKANITINSNETQTASKGKQSQVIKKITVLQTFINS